MKKIKYFFVILQFFLTSLIGYAQYIVQTAFPNITAFSNPVEMVNAGDGTNRLFIVQLNGRVFVINNSPTVSIKKTFIDMSSKVTFGGGSGLLGLAFHPDYESNRYFYTCHTFDSTSAGKWIRVSRFTANPSNPDTALLNTQLILLSARLVGGTTHTGGKIAFGPDGYLYISIGESFSSGASPAQDKTNLLGKISRINVDSPAPGMNYSIPPTNPFYQNNQGYREEIYAYGLRNLWKFSFDYPTNRLWAADVGEYLYEEINLAESGKNYGWGNMEGSDCRGVCDTTGMGFTRPLFEYPHDGQGACIIGGPVYRGSLHPQLYGKYIYCDQVRGNIWSLAYDGVNPPVSTQILDTTGGVSSFGEDENKEIYICTYATGRIFKLVNKGIITLNLKTAIEGFYNVPQNRLNMSDTAKVYLRSTVAPYSIADSSKTVINANSFSGLCFFNNAPTGKYYMVVKHRNSIETWSRNGGDSLIRGNSNSYDFTSGISMAYGNNLVQKGSKYCIFSGDVTQNGNVDVLDIAQTDNDVYNFVSGYVNTDIDGNNVVDVEDLLIAENNAFLFVGKVTPP